MSTTFLERITHDPRVMGGKPCIRGMRVTVGMILGELAAGHSEDEILAAFPYLEREDVRAALQFAAFRAHSSSAWIRWRCGGSGFEFESE